MNDNSMPASDSLRSKLQGWKIDGELLEKLCLKIHARQKAVGKKAQEMAESRYLKDLDRAEAHHLIGELMGLEKRGRGRPPGSGGNSQPKEPAQPPPVPLVPEQNDLQPEQARE